MTSPRAPLYLAALALLVFHSPARGQDAPIDRSHAPVLGPPPKVSLPPITTRQLPNGLKLMIVEQHELPLADFILVIGSGGTVDPTGKPGVANLTAAMADRRCRQAIESRDR